MKVNYIPKKYSTIMPYLHVNSGGADAIDFYIKGLGAKLSGKPFITPEGKLAYAELKIGDSKFALYNSAGDKNTEGSDESCRDTTVVINVYVRNVDKQIRQAVDAGAKETKPVEDRFYGDRSGQIVDPYGHLWELSTHKEDVSSAEMRKRAEKAYNKMMH
ncbi:MAG: VOC family protein [Oligoflexia bacterium]|nr:VOC family protein [Oligoflexia bacterium]